MQSVAALPLIPAMGLKPSYKDLPGNRYNCSNRLKISLNAFSFNKPLLDGDMSLDELIDFCADQGFFAVDITAYYFKGYPEVPSDEYIYEVKRKAQSKGIEISGTGVRNDFTHKDENRRKEEKMLVRNWIDVAMKLGAPVIRIFAGNQDLAGNTWDQAADRIINDILECVDYGKSRGVIVAMQNHDDFVKSAEQAIKILDRVNSPWFGLILDSGSFRQGDPYTEIARTANHAVNWQIKEEVYVNRKPEKVDLIRLFKIIRESAYRGYLPLETLGEGDPFPKVTAFMKQAKEALAAVSNE